MPKNPFAQLDIETLSDVVKNLERRWGLTLVSFLPPEAQARVVQLQDDIAALWQGVGDKAVREARPYIKFYDAQNFHCTHLTLTRSTPKGPILRSAFVKTGHDLFELFQEIHEVTRQLAPFAVELDRLSLAHDGLGIILLGACSDEVSCQMREKLLTTLNESLAEPFGLSRRSWDRDTSQFRKVHCALGYLKRPIPQTYETLEAHINDLRFSPIHCKFDKVVLVHHRYRSLVYPQEGEVTFPLGEAVEMTAEEFTGRINLAM